MLVRGPMTLIPLAHTLLLGDSAKLGAGSQRYIAYQQYSHLSEIKLASEQKMVRQPAPGLVRSLFRFVDALAFAAYSG
jgi:hypothetical protein